MSAPALDLQKAVLAALADDEDLTSALGGARIYDHVPADTPFPYLTFGRTSVFDWSTSTEAGFEQLLTLHAWSKAQGKTEALEIMDLVAARLNDQPLTLESHRLVSIRQEFSEVRYDEDLAVYHGLLRFRVLIEENA